MGLYDYKDHQNKSLQLNKKNCATTFRPTRKKINYIIYVIAAILVGFLAHWVYKERLIPQYLISSRINKIMIGKEWRIPNLEKMEEDWLKISESGELPYLVSEDFNGDGISDDAYFAVAKDGSKWALFVNLNSKEALPISYKIYEQTDSLSVQYMAISAAKPSEYQTACGKGYWACGKNEVPSLKITNYSLFFCAIEKSCDIVYWDKNKKKFQTITESD